MTTAGKRMDGAIPALTTLDGPPDRQSIALEVAIEQRTFWHRQHLSDCDIWRIVTGEEPPRAPSPDATLAMLARAWLACVPWIDVVAAGAKPPAPSVRARIRAMRAKRTPR